MEDNQDLSSQDQESLAGEVMQSLGEPGESGQQEVGDDDRDRDELPRFAKEKIGKIKHAHKKEMRSLQRRLDELEMRSSSGSPALQSQHQPMNPYTNQAIQPGSDEEKIHKAVTMAMRAKEDEERRAMEAQNAAYVNKHYESFNDHLDNASNKYDDFDEVVRSKDAPFTDSMRDMMSVIAKAMPDHATEVLYKLGKNKEELSRISKLHPLDQAAEVMTLSHALMGGMDKSQSVPKTMGQVKSNPVVSQHVNENTSVGELRRRMKEGGWKKWK